MGDPSTVLCIHNLETWRWVVACNQCTLDNNGKEGWVGPTVSSDMVENRKIHSADGKRTLLEANDYTDQAVVTMSRETTSLYNFSVMIYSCTVLLFSI
jgi:hypothetical protein